MLVIISDRRGDCPDTEHMTPSQPSGPRRPKLILARTPVGWRRVPHPSPPGSRQPDWWASFALIALVLGIVAFFLGLVPVLGLIVGAAAVTLGVLAIRQRQSKKMSTAGIILGAVAALASIGATAGLSAGPSDQRPMPAALPTASATSAPERNTPPAPQEAAPATPTTTPDAVTDEEVLSTFRSFLAERAAAGVLVAKAVTTVSYENRVLRVTFDPAAAGVDDTTFANVNPFENLANLVATPIAYDDAVGKRLRPAIDAIETVKPDGTSLGTYTAADILKLNDLSQ